MSLKTVEPTLVFVFSLFRNAMRPNAMFVAIFRYDVGASNPIDWFPISNLASTEIHQLSMSVVRCWHHSKRMHSTNVPRSRFDDYVRIRNSYILVHSCEQRQYDNVTDCIS